MATTVVTPIAKVPGSHSAFSSQISEHCVALLHQLRLRGPHCSVGLMSCTPGEGVTSLAAPLAATAARHLQLRTILVDCNFNHPSVHRTYGVPNNPGLQNALSDPNQLSEFIRPTAVENLSLLTAGEDKPGVMPDGSSLRLTQVFNELSDTFDLTIVDAPPFGHGASSGIACFLDGVLLVVEAERTRTDAVVSMASSLRGAGVNLLGVVMNKRREHVPPWLCELV